MSVAVARQRRASVQETGLRYGPVVLAAVVFALPLFWVLVTSLKKQSEYNSSPVVIVPPEPQWVNYQLAVTLADFWRFAGNSLVLSGAYALIVVFVSALVGYGFARLGLTNTYWPWILWALGGSPFAIFLFRQFFASFPRELDDAAEVDGAGPLRIFFQIYLPNAGPAIAATGIFMFLWPWGDYLYPSLLLHQENTTLAVRMASAYSDPHGNPWQTVTMAGVVLYVLPLILLFAFAQRFIIRGIVTTGIKG